MFQTQPASSVSTAYLTSDLASLFGVSLRQLQWWDEQRVVSPRHSGHRRIYLPSEALEVAVIAELRRKGFSLQNIRHVLQHLQREMGKRLREAGASDLYLLLDGKSIYLETGAAAVMDVLKKSKLPIHLVSVSDQVKRLANGGISRATKTPA